MPGRTMKTMLLEGKRVVLTGAARGIGLAAARACFDHGAEVLMTDLDAEALAEAASGLGADDRVRHASLDVTDGAAIAEALETVADWPAIDALCNNAAILDIGHTADTTEERYAEVLDVNLTGALRVTQAALPMLRRSSGASIINTVSVQAFQGVPDSAAYASAKGGLMMLTRSMAVDFGAEGIRANAIAPGFIDTRMAVTTDGEHEHEMPEFRAHYIDGGRIPLRRPGTPEDCAGAFVFLVSDLSRYITGQAICVDGGLSATY